MVVLHGNFALGCGPGTDYPYIHIFQCMLERTYAITKDVLEQITFVLAYHTVIIFTLRVMQRASQGRYGPKSNLLDDINLQCQDSRKHVQCFRMHMLLDSDFTLMRKYYHVETTPSSNHTIRNVFIM